MSDIQQNFNYGFKEVENKKLDLIGAIWAIEQDNLGFLWFGGENGLARFDGYEVTIFKHEAENPNSLSSSYIHDLLVDKDGVLWIATSYGLNRFLAESERFEHYFAREGEEYSLGGNDIQCIEEDSFGTLWIGTAESGLSRFNKELSRFQRFQHNPNDQHSLASNGIYSLLVDNTGFLWVGTRNHGLDKISLTTELSAANAKFSHFVNSETNPRSLSSNSVVSLYQDRRGKVWIGTVKGLNVYSPETNQFTRFFANESSPFKFTQTIGEDGFGNLWTANSGKGINVFDRLNNSFVHFKNDPSNPTSLVNNNVRAFFLDRDHNFWLGHFASGVSMQDPYGLAFSNFYHNPNIPSSLNFNEIVTLAETRKGNIFVGTSRGLNLLNKESGEVQRFIHDPKNTATISNTGVLGVLMDSSERLWVGFWGDGLNRLDPDTDEFVHYREGIGSNLSSNYIWAIGEDSEKRIWVGTHDHGLNYFDEAKNQFVAVPSKTSQSEGINCKSVFYIFKDSMNDLWVGCSNGLHRRKKKTLDFQHFHHIEGDSNSLSADHILAINEDSSGLLWIGTQGGGVNSYDRKTGRMTSYSVKNGLADDVVTGILQDSYGYLWFSTGNGLSRFNLKSHKFKNYTQEYGISGDVFNRAAFLKTKDNQLVFGSKDGLTVVYPNKISENTIPPKVVITEFKLFNKDVEIQAEGSPLKKSIILTDSLVLNHNQSSFSFQFSALNYRVSSDNKYAYLLDGFDQDWIEIDNRRNAYYTNLDPGSYRFRVKASNNEGVWSLQDAVINIVILPAWWATWWAYFVYGIVFVIFILGYIFAIWQRKKIENERRVNERLRLVDKSKDIFITHTTHELRTPLNGMIGLAESLRNGIASGHVINIENYLDMIVLSGKRLVNLVNDLLDYSKLRDQQILLKKKAVDVFSISEVVLTLFQPLITGKMIVLKNVIPKNLPLVMVDEDRLQQILFNLLENAVKHTQNGSVKLSGYVCNNMLRINVQDTGEGFSQDQWDKIFPSNVLASDDSGHQEIGIGVGLAVTKQLIELHGGEISFESILGKGSCFSFTLPLLDTLGGEDNGKLSAQSISGLGSDKQDISNVLPASGVVKSEPFNPRHHLLIVDDEPVNRMVLECFLKVKNYRITECSSGLDALNFLSQNKDVDLVLLDVMMPRLSGFEVCKKIRENYSLTQLPVIFLTGMNSHSDIEAGYAVGGNDFLIKPVSKEELLSRVDTHLKLSDQLSNTGSY